MVYGYDEENSVQCVLKILTCLHLWTLNVTQC